MARDYALLSLPVVTSPASSFFRSPDILDYTGTYSGGQNYRIEVNCSHVVTLSYGQCNTIGLRRKHAIDFLPLALVPLLFHSLLFCIFSFIIFYIFHFFLVIIQRVSLRCFETFFTSHHQKLLALSLSPAKSTISAPCRPGPIQNERTF